MHRPLSQYCGVFKTSSDQKKHNKIYGCSIGHQLSIGENNSSSVILALEYLAIFCKTVHFFMNSFCFLFTSEMAGKSTAQLGCGWVGLIFSWSIHPPTCRTRHPPATYLWKFIFHHPPPPPTTTKPFSSNFRNFSACDQLRPSWSKYTAHTSSIV